MCASDLLGDVPQSTNDERNAKRHKTARPNPRQREKLKRREAALEKERKARLAAALDDLLRSKRPVESGFSFVMRWGPGLALEETTVLEFRPRTGAIMAVANDGVTTTLYCHHGIRGNDVIALPPDLEDLPKEQLTLRNARKLAKAAMSEKSTRKARGPAMEPPAVGRVVLAALENDGHLFLCDVEFEEGDDPSTRRLRCWNDGKRTAALAFPNTSVLGFGGDASIASGAVVVDLRPWQGCNRALGGYEIYVLLRELATAFGLPMVDDKFLIDLFVLGAGSKNLEEGVSVAAADRKLRSAVLLSNDDDSDESIKSSRRKLGLRGIVLLCDYRLLASAQQRIIFSVVWVAADCSPWSTLNANTNDAKARSGAISDKAIEARGARLEAAKSELLWLESFLSWLVNNEDNRAAAVVLESTRNMLPTYEVFDTLRKIFGDAVVTSGFAYGQEVEGFPVMHCYNIWTRNIDLQLREPRPAKSPNGRGIEECIPLEGLTPSGSGSMTKAAAPYSSLFCAEIAPILVEFAERRRESFENRLVLPRET